MSSIFDALLDDTEGFDDPAKRQAVAAALRKQQNYGTLGQLMGVDPTMRAGVSMQEGVQTSLRQALAKQLATKEAKARASERQQAQGNWQAQMERDQARDAEQKRQFAAQEERLSRQQDTEAKAQWAADPATGRLYNKYTGEWKDDTGQGQAQGAPEVTGFPGMPSTARPLTEGQNKNFLGATTMATTLPGIEEQIKFGWGPSQMDKFAAGPMLPGWQKVVQGIVPRSWASKEGEAYFNAGRQIIGAILRPESGGAITEDEWTEYGPQWLPWPGDSDSLRRTKIEKLRNRMEAMASQTGSAARYWQTPQAGNPQSQSQGRNFEAEYGLGAK